MGESSDSQRTPTAPSARSEETDVERLPASPGGGISRIDTLSEDFIRSITHRPLVAGEIISGRYKLERELGDGAMGQVFVAQNLTIGQRVAIKVLKPELLADASLRQRFQREAEALAAVNHRNVVRLLDVIVGNPTFLVLEYLSGPTLARTLRSAGRLEIDRAVRIAERLCWALHAAHQAGIVHRDVKPSNVILTPDAESGEEPKLIDFGLAKLTDAKAQLTGKGEIVGTPHYMSPEQVAGTGIDLRTDVYALGCLLYHLLTGQPPFTGEDLQILYQQVREPAVPLAKLRPDTPPRLDEIVRRALAKESKDRFTTMVELAEALRAVRKSVTQPAAAAAAPAAPRRRLRVWHFVAAVAIAGACGLGLGALSLRLQHQAKGSAILITSQPPGATVEVDGQPLTDTTPTFVASVTPGKHRVRTQLVRYLPREESVEVVEGTRALVELAMTRLGRTLEIRTVPSGASVSLDGQPAIGRTPMQLQLTEGDFHILTIEKAGYIPLRKRVVPEDPAMVSFELEPETEPRGMVWVESPRLAEVLVDGTERGYYTPTPGMRVAAGEHLFQLRDENGAIVGSRRLRVEQGGTTHVIIEWTAPKPETVAQ